MTHNRNGHRYSEECKIFCLCLAIDEFASQLYSLWLYVVSVHWSASKRKRLQHMLILRGQWTLLHSIALVNPICGNYLVQCFIIKWVGANCELSSHRNLLHGIDSTPTKYDLITSTNKRSAENICEQSRLNQLMCLITRKSVQFTPYTPVFAENVNYTWIAQLFSLKQYFLPCWAWYTCRSHNNNVNDLYLSVEWDPI